MQKRRDFKERLVAALTVFMLFVSNFATLGSALISYAADDSAEKVSYSAQFVMIENDGQEETEEQPQEEVVQVEQEEESQTTEEAENQEANVVDEETGESTGEEILESGTTEEIVENGTEAEDQESDETENSTEEEPTEEVVTEEVSEEVKEQELESGLALEITIGVQDSGYLKNAKVEIKNLANQIFELKDNISYGEYIQSIDENKIKLKQINSGTEIKVYIPIELKDEESIDVTTLQTGVNVVLTGTYVDEEGLEEIFSKAVTPVLSISNNVNLVLNGSVEKCIPYVQDETNKALVQLRVTAESGVDNNLPIKDTTIQVQIPQIEGATIENLSVSAINTAYTNGLTDSDVVFTAENWSYENDVVTISVDNVEADGKYKMNTGKDEYIISYTYVNVSELTSQVLTSNIYGMSNIFTSEGTTEVSNEIQKEYNLSQANSNIITYEVTAKSQDVSKGYLYANQNSDEPEYEVEFENALSVNISRVDMINIVEIRESAEYFLDESGNQYNTSTDDGLNTYYKSIKVSKENLVSIIGDTGNFELLLEDGTSLIQITSSTEDDGDGYITISFGENKIDKILMRINNPVGDGILNIGAIKVADKTIYGKTDLMQFKSLNNEYVAAAELTEGIITEMGTVSTSIDLIDTTTNATVSLSRNDLSTLVDNEDIEINISLNNAVATSDMYKNPVFELTLPEEVEELEVTDINLLYGNDELEIANVETLTNSNGQIVLKVTLTGAQTQYTAGDSDKGTTIILNTNMSVNMYTASRDAEIVMNYYNEDATNYAIGSDWTMMSTPSSYMLIGRQGTYDTELDIVAPEGFVNAQMISNYKDDSSIISINQGTKTDTISTFADSRTAQMQMILINNSDEEMSDVHILGRTIFSGNKSIISSEELGTNQDAPMTSAISALSGNDLNATIYYSENGEATDNLEDSSNGWTTTVDNYRNVKSYLIVANGTLKVGGILMYSYNFEIPANLNNNLDLCATFGTYYTGTKTAGIAEADKVMLSTGDAPVLSVETVSDTSEETAVAGQHIKYTIKITNSGRTTAKDVVVNSIIPDGTTYIENGELKPDVTELKIEIDSISAGSTEEVSYEVEVNEDVTEGTSIESNNNVEAEGLEVPIYTTTASLPVQQAEVMVLLEADKENRVIEENSNIYYTVHVINMEGTQINNSKVVQYLPEGVQFVEAYIEEFEDDGITSYKGAEGVYNASDRTVTWTLDSVLLYKTFKLTVQTEEISELEKSIDSYAVVTADNLDRSYESETVENTLARAQIEATYYSTTNNKYIKEGDTIEYVLELTNTGKAEATKINVSNIVPEELRVTSLTCTKDDYTYSGLSGDDLNMTLNLEVGQTATIVMDCTVENLSNSVDEQLTANNWVISGTNLDVVTTSAVENIVQQSPEATDNTYESDSINVATTGTNTELNSSSIAVNATSSTESLENVLTYRIIGTAFYDANQNGQRDDNEEGMENVVAKLCDASSQEVVNQVVTNSIGEYVFDNVVSGEYYIKFEYDSAKYQLTAYQKEGVNSDRNSDAIISNYKAVTDKIKVTDTSISDIDIGLIRAGIFDLTLDVNVNQITVQNDDETITYEMENSKLAKVDINPQYANSSTVYVEYTIDVTNKGEIAGYVKSIVDYIPDELTLDTSLNPNWYIAADGYAYTNELEDIVIQPGETKTVTLVLTKQMTEESTGLINNVFEINETYNEYAIADIDSTEGNMAQGEDDMSSSDVILGTQTGSSVINVMIISATLITLLITLYVIKLQIDKKNKEVIV